SEQLLPVLVLTNKLAAVEAQRRKAAEGGDAVSHKAEQLRLMGDRVKELRQILLEVKDEHARGSLRAAGPRAQQFYSLLVDHPFFNTLTIETEEKAGSLGYCYRVSN